MITVVLRSYQLVYCLLVYCLQKTEEITHPSTPATIASGKGLNDYNVWTDRARKSMKALLDEIAPHLLR